MFLKKVRGSRMYFGASFGVIVDMSEWPKLLIHRYDLQYIDSLGLGVHPPDFLGIAICLTCSTVYNYSGK